MYEVLLVYYVERHYYTKEQVKRFLDNGKITQEEYDRLVMLAGDADPIEDPIVDNNPENDPEVTE